MHVYIIGCIRWSKATPLFVYGHSAIPVEMKWQTSRQADAVDAPPLPGHASQIGTSRHVRGSDIDGWIVIGEAFCHPFQIRASRQALFDLGERNPQQLDAMVKDYAATSRHH